MRLALKFATILSLVFTQASSQDYNKGIKAYEAGDHTTALKELKPLVDSGNRLFQNLFGNMYEFGKGELKDYKKAVKFYRLSAEQDYADAQFNLGNMLENGKGVLQDSTEAVKWYKLSAEQGFVKAQHNLGSMYALGKGVLVDFAEAMKWWRLSAKQGYANTHSNLGNMYEGGYSVLQDNLKAHMWYNISSANGYEIAGEYRDKVASKMTTEDISKATAMAKECMKSDYKKCGY